MHSKKYPVATRILAVILGGWCLAGLLGCCGKNTKLDYGRSVTHNLASQVVDPTAGQTVHVSRGQTPEAAVNAYEKYNKSFKPDEKKPMYKLTTEGL
jgi:hypothetical protein